MLWHLARLHYEPDELDLVILDDGLILPSMLHVESLSYEQSMLGMTVGEHPMERYRDWLDSHGVLNSTDLMACEYGQIVRVAGVDIMHQAPPTAKGHHFITLEDEYGMMNIIVRPNVYEKHRLVLRTSRMLIVEGEVQRKDNVVNILLARTASIPQSLTEPMAV
jgi:error-prone DNA polymerase